MPGGRSYIAKILSDAGTNYLWSENQSSGSLKLSFESVVEKASNADFWINPGNFTTLQSLAESDPRFRIFSAFRRGKVFNMNRKIAYQLPDDYFSMALSNPHKLLKDLIHVFHPGLLPRHKPEWYHQLQ